VSGWLSAFDPNIGRDAYAEAMANPVAPPDPGPTDNLGTAIGAGIVRGGASVARAVQLAGAVVPITADALLGTNTQSSYFRAMDDSSVRAADYWTPNAQETGSVSRVVGGLAEMALPLMVSGGNPAAMAGITGAAATAGAGIDLARQGADAGAAGGVAAVQGAVTAVSAFMPMFGKSLGAKMALGAGTNLATNVPAAAASQAILGDSNLAAQYDPLDVEARAVDVLTGMLFGGMAHLGAHADNVDAALTAANSLHAERSTAPGIPHTPADASAHVDALNANVDALSAGDPPAVPSRQISMRPDEQLAQTDEVRILATDSIIADGPGMDDLFDPKFMLDAMPDPLALPVPVKIAASADGLQMQGADPVVMAARQAAADNPALLLRIDDGTDAGHTTTAAAALAQADTEAKAADELSTGFDAAINCFMKTGVM